MTKETIRYRPAAERSKDFVPARLQLTPAGAALEGNNCDGCNAAMRCVSSGLTLHDTGIILTGCPIGRNIPAFNKLAARGLFKDAVLLDWADQNYMGALTGWLCPASHATLSGSYCMTQCIHSLLYGAHNNAKGSVDIPNLEALAHTIVLMEGDLPHLNPLGRNTGKSIGYIGDGAPAFYYAANVMEHGHGFSMYGRGNKPGGVVINEITSFKIDPNITHAYFNHLASCGGIIRTNTDIGQGNIAHLAGEHDVLVMGIGKSQAKKAHLEGTAANEQISYQDLLNVQNMACAAGKTLIEFTEGKVDFENRVTAVMGMGETAMDCVRTLLRNGAKKIQVHYYRDPGKVSSDPVDRRLAFEEAGVVLNTKMIDLLKKDGLSDQDIRDLSEAYDSNRIEFIFDSQVKGQNKGSHTYTNEYELVYEEGGVTKTQDLGVPVIIATGAGVENPTRQFGLPDQFLSKSNGALIVDHLADDFPELTGNPSNNPGMVVSGLTCIIKTNDLQSGKTKLVPMISNGDCVTSERGLNGPEVLVHAFAGAKAMRRPVNNLLKDPNMVKRIAERHPEMVWNLAA